MASALRLLDSGKNPEWVERVVAFLPPDLAVPAWVDRAQLTIAADRRAAIIAAREVWRRQTPSSESGLLAGESGQLLWWLPRDDGGRDVMWSKVGDWLASIRSVGESSS